MNYQNLLCLGDSQTFGARTYGCYPLHLARLLTERSRYEWSTISWSVNGFTARDLWFLVNERIGTLQDTFQACLLIGTNDVGEKTDSSLFLEYYRQILRTLFIHGFKVVYCGLVPPIFADGHVFFDRDCEARRSALNAELRELVEQSPRAQLVDLEELSNDEYVDPVHLNERGNVKIAEAFARIILQH